MKKLLLPFLALLLGACSSEDATLTRQVTVCVDNLQEEYSTRASMSEAGMTDLYIFEGQTLLTHKVSTDADFNAPSVSLTYGSHSLTVVGSKSQGQSYTGGVWSCTKVDDTFSAVKTMSVNGQSAPTISVTPARRVSKLMFTIEDAFPSAVKTMHIKADNYLSLNSDNEADDAVVFEVSKDVSSWTGKTSMSPSVLLLTAEPSGEQDCDVMIEFLGSGNNVLYHYERTVKLKPNRCTNLRGEFFSGGESTITVSTDWETTNNVDLF